MHTILEYITRLFKRAETNAAKKEKSKKEDAIYPQNVEDFFTLDLSMCVLFVRGVNPFMDKKFICENHKNFI